MRVKIEGAHVVRYGTYGSEDKPLKYEHGDLAGQTIDYADVLTTDAGSGDAVNFRMTLAPSINGDRTPAGGLADLEVVVKKVTKVVRGTERTYEQIKWQVVAMRPHGGQPKAATAPARAA